MIYCLQAWQADKCSTSLLIRILQKNDLNETSRPEKFEMKKEEVPMSSTSRPTLREKVDEQTSVLLLEESRETGRRTSNKMAKKH